MKFLKKNLPFLLSLLFITLMGANKVEHFLYQFDGLGGLVYKILLLDIDFSNLIIIFCFIAVPLVFQKIWYIMALKKKLPFLLALIYLLFMWLYTHHVIYSYNGGTYTYIGFPFNMEFRDDFTLNKNELILNVIKENLLKIIFDILFAIIFPFAVQKIWNIMALKRKLPFLLAVIFVIAGWACTGFIYNLISGFPLMQTILSSEGCYNCYEIIDFSYSYLIFDIVFLILFPLAVQKIWNIVTKKKATKQ